MAVVVSVVAVEAAVVVVVTVFLVVVVDAVVVFGVVVAAVVVGGVGVGVGAFARDNVTIVFERNYTKKEEEERRLFATRTVTKIVPSTENGQL